MAENIGIWPSGYDQRTNIKLLDGCEEKFISSTVLRGYDFCKPGGHLGNVGLASKVGNFREGKA